MSSAFSSSAPFLASLDRAAQPTQRANIDAILPFFGSSFEKLGFVITDPEEIACFIGQTSHETGGYAAFVESFNYDEAGLLRTFGARLTAAQRQLWGRTATRVAQQEAIANAAYGGDFGRRRLGNREPGDGARYRGRGLIQTTGRNNYEAAAKTAGVDYVAQPELLGRPEHAVFSALAFWRARPALRAAAQRGDVDAVSRIVNGGTNGLADRRLRTDRVLRFLRSQSTPPTTSTPPTA
jgi:putative chitinase